MESLPCTPDQVRLGSCSGAPRSVRHALNRIVRNREVMRWIGSGDVWGAKKVSRFFHYCELEERQREGRSTYFWKIMVTFPGRQTSFVGVVGIHPSGKRCPPVYLTIFLDPGVHGRQIGTYACIRALAAYWEIHPRAAVHIDVRTDNAPMNRLARGLHFSAKKRPHRIGRCMYNRYTVSVATVCGNLRAARRELAWQLWRASSRGANAGAPLARFFGRNPGVLRPAGLRILKFWCFPASPPCRHLFGLAYPVLMRAFARETQDSPAAAGGEKAWLI